MLPGSRRPGIESREDWQKSHDVNIKGVYNVSTAFAANALSDATISITSSAIEHLFRLCSFSTYGATELVVGPKIMQ